MPMYTRLVAAAESQSASLDVIVIEGSSTAKQLLDYGSLSTLLHR